MGLETIRCNVCGAEVAKDSTTCPYCGCSVKGDGETPTVYTSETAEKEAQEEVTSSFDYVNSFRNARPNPYKKPETEQEKADALKFTWAKILRILMGLSALGFVKNLTEMLSGITYKDAGTTAELAYSYYGKPLKYLDTFYEIVMVVLMVLAIAAIIALNRFKSTAAFFVIAGYAGSVLAGIAVAAGRTVIFGVNNFRAPVIGSMLGSVFMLIINIIYFKKSKNIFVN